VMEQADVADRFGPDDQSCAQASLRIAKDSLRSQLAEIRKERDMWKNRCIVEEQAKNAALRASSAFEKAIAAAEEEKQHWQMIAETNHQHLSAAIEEATGSARKAFQERQQWQERCIAEEAGRLEALRAKDEAVEALHRFQAEHRQALDAAQQVLDAVIMELLLDATRLGLGVPANLGPPLSHWVPPPILMPNEATLAIPPTSPEADLRSMLPSHDPIPPEAPPPILVSPPWA